MDDGVGRTAFGIRPKYTQYVFILSTGTACRKPFDLDNDQRRNRYTAPFIFGKIM